MKLTFHLEGDVAERLRERAGAPLDRSRTQLVRESLKMALRDVILRNPVDTGRSRGAWVNALEQIGGTAPAGWEGPHPSATDAGRQQGRGAITESTALSEGEAVNSVNYISSLEYGTSRMSPFAMVRGALQRLSGQLSGFFRF